MINDYSLKHAILSFLGLCVLWILASYLYSLSGLKNVDFSGGEYGPKGEFIPYEEYQNAGGGFSPR